MADATSSHLDSSTEAAQPKANISGGVNLETPQEATIGRDVVGRDKIESAGHDIINVGSGATVNIIAGTPSTPESASPTRPTAITGGESNRKPRQRSKANQGSTKKKRTNKDATRVPIIVAIISALAVLGAAIINNLASLTPGPLPPQCPYQGESDPITLANLINAEAEAVDNQDMAVLEKIFTPTARIRNRMNDRSVSDKKLEWTSPRAYYQDSLFGMTTVTSTIHSHIMPAGQGIGSVEAWLTSASSGYANGVKFENGPGSDHWRFIKNQAGCWVIAEFDFNAGHIPFP